MAYFLLPARIGRSRGLADVAARIARTSTLVRVCGLRWGTTRVAWCGRKSRPLPSHVSLHAAAHLSESSEARQKVEPAGVAGFGPSPGVRAEVQRGFRSTIGLR